MITQFIQDRAGALLVALAACFASYMTGRSDGRESCVASMTRAALAGQEQANAVARKQIARATATGAAREADRSHVNAVFDRLNEEAQHDAIAPTDDDSCTLPAERLRRWAAANAGGADKGSTIAEPDGPASSPASAFVWPHARLGSQSPRSGPALSPVGESALPVVAVPGASE